ncbi:acylphosphatase [Haloglycomyces albus]|uniref:acylphosphatase n=1 Tax=Haloglycomyces albus TaxID=526067 RepID=UPI00046D8028|nr:acylphosphatase [Haloglycomyces albus]
MIRVYVRVVGRVQGVFFRDSCSRRAVSDGLSGWVRNVIDGSVEGVFEGDDDVVERMVEWMSVGPEAAEVREMESVRFPPEGERGFRIAPTGMTRFDG